MDAFNNGDHRLDTDFRPSGRRDDDACRPGDRHHDRRGGQVGDIKGVNAGGAVGQVDVVLKFLGQPVGGILEGQSAAGGGDGLGQRVLSGGR